MEGSVLNLLVLPDTGGLYQGCDLSIDDYRCPTSFILSVRTPTEKGNRGFLHWSVLAVCSSQGRCTPGHPLSPSFFYFMLLNLGALEPIKALLCAPQGPQSFSYQASCILYSPFLGFGLWAWTTLASALLSRISRQGLPWWLSG